MEGKETFATAVIAVQEGQACEGNTIEPEPVDGLGGDGGEIVLVDREGVGRWQGGNRDEGLDVGEAGNGGKEMVPCGFWLGESGVVFFQ